MRAGLAVLLGVSALCFAVPAAPAQASPEWVISRMGNGMKADVTWESVRSGMLQAFYLSNPDERGVSVQGIDNLRKVMMAQRRSQVIAQILNHDLDGDGKVTKDEIVAVMQPRARQMIQTNGVQLEPTLQQVRRILDQLVGDALKPDADGDGVISADEIQQQAQRQADQAGSGWPQNAAQFVPMTLDADGDGVVSLAEFEVAVREQFDAVDRDRDGRVSADEFGEFGKRLNEARQTAQRAREAQARKLRLAAAVVGCDVPAAPAGARLVLLGAQQSKALSNAWIGTQDRLTTVTTVEIAPGPEPLYLALTSGNATIWDVVGATERVAGIVAHAETGVDKAGRVQQRVADAGAAPPAAAGVRPLVGVMGVPREKIHFTARTGCLVPATEATMKDGSTQEIATLLLGRAADEIGGENSAGTFRVPATRHFPNRTVRNAIQLPKEGPGAVLWREVEEEYPAGIAQVDVDSVISAHPVRRYAVLPGRAGLAELVDAGVLSVSGMSRGIRILGGGDFKPFTSPDRFTILAKTRLPAGAAGTFILGRDVPRPEGDLSQVCIRSEADQKPLEGSRTPSCP